MTVMGHAKFRDADTIDDKFQRVKQSRWKKHSEFRAQPAWADIRKEDFQHSPIKARSVNIISIFKRTQPLTTLVLPGR